MVAVAMRLAGHDSPMYALVQVQQLPNLHRHELAKEM